MQIFALRNQHVPFSRIKLYYTILFWHLPKQKKNIHAHTRTHLFSPTCRTIRNHRERRANNKNKTKKNAYRKRNPKWSRVCLPVCKTNKISLHWLTERIQLGLYRPYSLCLPLSSLLYNKRILYQSPPDRTKKKIAFFFLLNSVYRFNVIIVKKMMNSND